MTQIAEEHKQQVRASVERVDTKLLDFHAELPADEQLVLDLALNRLVAGDEAASGQETDARGHMIAEERIRPSPKGTGGDGGFPDHFARNVQVLFGAVAESKPWRWP